MIQIHRKEEVIVKTEIVLHKNIKRLEQFSVLDDTDIVSSHDVTVFS